MTPLLSVTGLGKTFRQGGGLLGGPARDVHAVDGVDFSIAPGETLALVGESGCGKTTIGRMILRLVEPSAGTISFEGEDVRALRGEALRAFRRKVGIVFQDPYGSLNPRMTVARILEDPLRVNTRMGRLERAANARRLLDEVGLPAAAADRYPHEFSGGQRQRIVIARALAVNPDFVVCDEPVSALDVRTQAQIVDLLHDLQDKLKLSYLFIAHDLAIVRAVAHQVAVMYGGRIVEFGDADDVYDNPTHPYTKNLLEAVPIPTPPASAPSSRLPSSIRSSAAATARPVPASSVTTTPTARPNGTRSGRATPSPAGSGRRASRPSTDWSAPASLILGMTGFDFPPFMSRTRTWTRLSSTRWSTRFTRRFWIRRPGSMCR